MFKLVKEIRNKEGELHFKRYRIIETPWFNLYVHRIYKADQDHALHNHSWWFIGMILWGNYIEEYKVQENIHSRFWTASYRNRTVLSGPRYCSRDAFHKISSLDKPVTTLVLTGPRAKEPWGYWCWIQNKEHWNYNHWGFLTHEEFRKQKRGIKKGDPQYE